MGDPRNDIINCSLYFPRLIKPCSLRKLLLPVKWTLNVRHQYVFCNISSSHLMYTHLYGTSPIMWQFCGNIAMGAWCFCLFSGVPHYRWHVVSGPSLVLLQIRNCPFLGTIRNCKLLRTCGVVQKSMEHTKLWKTAIKVWIVLNLFFHQLQYTILRTWQIHWDKTRCVLTSSGQEAASVHLSSVISV